LPPYATFWVDPFRIGAVKGEGMNDGIVIRMEGMEGKGGIGGERLVSLK